MRIAVALVAIAVTAVFGCSEARPRCAEYHFQAGFPAELRGSARSAAANWESFSGRPLPVADGDTDQDACSFRAVDFGSPAYVALRDESGGDFFAVHLDDGSIVVAEGGWSTDDACVADVATCATFVLMHEIGHEYGLQHVADGDAIMGTTNPVPRVSYNAVDRAECERAGACVR